MKRINFIFAVALMLGATACGNSQKSETKNNEAVEVERVAPVAYDMTGTFSGTLPAADCEGILTTLIVNADSTYSLKSEYLGVKDGVFEIGGVYNILQDGLIELITPSSGERTYYKRIGNGYMLSDSVGTVNQGELAEHYILKSL